MRRKRKGQMVSLLTVFSLIFISSGSLITSVFGSQTIQKTIQYSSNDVNALAEAKTNSELYKYNIRNEMNYTFNNVAWEIAARAGGNLEWEDNIPDNDSMRASFSEEYFTRPEVNIVEQNRAGDCSPPQLSRSAFEIKSKHRLAIETLESYITCTRTGTEAMIPVAEKYEVYNPNNTYFKLAENARKLAKEAQRIIEQTEWVREGSAVSGLSEADSCEEHTGSDDAEAEEEAKEVARDEFNSLSIANEAFDNLDSKQELSGSSTDEGSENVIDQSEAVSKAKEQVSDQDTTIESTSVSSNDEEGYYDVSVNFEEDENSAEVRVDGSSGEVIDSTGVLGQLYSFVGDRETETIVNDGIYSDASEYPKTKECEYCPSDECEEDEDYATNNYEVHKKEFEATEVEVKFAIADTENEVVTYEASDTELVFDFNYVNTEDLD